ncbi:ABC transporter permease [uncultured Actinomyces sp.]|uniref:ABC transporter permease n=1 Tax=uncultured Actinomyces sp. TaxID=249061 RepID=UPI0028D3DB3D|nr:ABC transporter permease [uncultured Actinomyces sp.]
MNSILTGFFGAIVEAWAQLRIGKLRILLSLVGVAAAVATMAFVIAVGQITVNTMNKAMEQYGGRPGTVTINVSPTGKGLSQAVQADDAPDAEASATPGGGAGNSGGSGGGSAGSGSSGGSAGGASTTTSAATSARISEAMNGFVERNEVSSWATTYTSNVRFSFPEGARSVTTQTVSLSYGLMHHKAVAQGRWFTAQDEDDLSPSLVVTQGFLDEMGIEKFTGPITINSFSPVQTSFTIVGVLKPENLKLLGCTGDAEQDKDLPCKQPVNAFALNTSYEQWLPKDADRPAPTLEVWAGKSGAKELANLAKKDLDARFGQGSTQASDNLSSSGAFSADSFTTGATMAGALVMVLGALSLVNISLVTVRQRIHEIGVRRSFGATSRRIFFSIMLESVVATMVAGIVGIGLAIAALRFLPWADLMNFPEAPTVSSFPMVAAVIGLAAATVVGALAGIIPAIVATRIRPIDAIRY